jgi:hypothetical protein
MFVQRSVAVENLVLVRNPKPCKARLEVGDYVKLNGIRGGHAVRVAAIVGDKVTVESEDWRGNPELFVFPRICLRKARLATLFHLLRDYFCL